MESQHQLGSQCPWATTIVGSTIAVWCLVAFSLSGCYAEPRSSPPFPSRQPRRHRSAPSPRTPKISLSRLHPFGVLIPRASDPERIKNQPCGLHEKA
ncbi:hypothetical protein EDB85DRAFT_1563183 [Lactarius pseudohatsudake]|nr:hypothetical protein EDB85DRAFT_1563183 [Lactarius pseudohatsudake]